MYGPIHSTVIFTVSPTEIPVREILNKEKETITTPSSPKKKLNPLVFKSAGSREKRK